MTIPISHYCEKARWALDRAGIAYTEERHVQGVHRIVARKLSGGLTVPVLVTDAGPVAESAQILEWVDRRSPAEHGLFPSDRGAHAEVARLCQRFDEVLGPRGRRLLYVNMFNARDMTLNVNNQGVPRWEDRAIRVGWPLITRLVRRVLDITPGIEVEDERVVFSELDYVAELLADGRPYLAGDRFSAADLTFAALCSPLIAPPEYGIVLPQPETLPPAIATLMQRARDHPAGSFALKQFAEHRRETLA